MGENMKDVEQILNNVVGTMELSGFNINDQEKEMLRQMIRGEKSFDELKAEVLKKINDEVERQDKKSDKLNTCSRQSR